MYDTDYTPVATLSDAHAQWHSIHGAFATCPLDCGIGYDAIQDAEDAGWYDEAPQVACGHCKGRHTIAGVAVCAAAHYAK